MRLPKKGFTLIELLVSIAIIGLVWFWVGPRPAPRPERMWVAEMKNSHIKHLQAQQEYYSKHGRYLLDLDSLREETGYQADKHVTVTLVPIDTGAVKGFNARAIHEKTSIVCQLEYGTDPKGTEALSSRIVCSPIELTATPSARQSAQYAELEQTTAKPSRGPATHVATGR